MLQPRHSESDQQLIVARMLWGALTFSMIIYGVVLFITGKVSAVALPSGELQPIEMIALAANGTAIAVYMFYKNSVETQATIEKRFTGYIICWALNESIVLFGFVAVFIGGSGNAFFYLANLMVALTGNLLTFPKKD